MKIVIIGGSAAGMSAAAKAKRVDPSVEIAVYEKSDIISFGACGLPYFVGDFFSDSKMMLARTVTQMREAGIDVNIGHEALEVDPNRHSVKIRNIRENTVETVSYDRLMIATGATVFKPPFFRDDAPNLFTLTKLEDGIRLKEALSRKDIRDITIIGGGFIGIEAVEAMLHQGKRVRLIQRASRIFNRVYDARMTSLMEDELRSKGVSLVLGEGVETLEGEHRITHVRTDKARYGTDLVIVATGFTPQTAFLSDIGLQMLSNGAIVTDRMGRTNLPDIYAAGDCATVKHMLTGEDVYLPLATGANKLGRVVGENMAGKEAYYPGTLGSSCVKVLDLEAARTGLDEATAGRLGREVSTVFIQDKDQTHYYPGQTDIYIKLVYERKSKKIVGGEIVGGKGAALRVDVIATAIAAGMTTEMLGMMDFCYAPPISKTWDPLNVAGNAAK